MLRRNKRQIHPEIQKHIKSDIVLRLSSLHVLVFVASMLPGTILYFIDGSTQPSTLRNIFSLVTLLNSIFDPLLFFFVHRNKLRERRIGDVGNGVASAFVVRRNALVESQELSVNRVNLHQVGKLIGQMHAKLDGNS